MRDVAAVAEPEAAGVGDIPVRLAAVFLPDPLQIGRAHV